MMLLLLCKMKLNYVSFSSQCPIRQRDRQTSYINKKMLLKRGGATLIINELKSAHMEQESGKKEQQFRKVLLWNHYYSHF